MYQVQSSNTYSSRAFLGRWVIANLLAGLGCSAAALLLSRPLVAAINQAMGWNESFEDFQGILLVMLLGVIVTGLVLGYAQRKVLERDLAPVGRWMLATALAVPAAALLALVIGAGSTLLGMLMPGLMVGVAQMLVLLRHTRLAGWWVMASALAVGGALLLAGLVVAPVLEGAVVAPEVLAVVGGSIAAWSFYAVTSGLALSWLLRRR